MLKDILIQAGHSLILKPNMVLYFQQLNTHLLVYIGVISPEFHSFWVVFEIYIVVKYISLRNTGKYQILKAIALFLSS